MHMYNTYTYLYEALDTLRKTIPYTTRREYKGYYRVHISGHYACK